MRLVPVFALLALTTPALAHQDTGAPGPVEKPADKKICRPMPQTGSIMVKRECHTKAEWDAISQRSASAREKLDRDYNGRTGGIGQTSGSN